MKMVIHKYKCSNAKDFLKNMAQLMRDNHV